MTTNTYFTLSLCPDEVPHLLATVKIAQWLHVSVIRPYLGWTVKHYGSVSLACVSGYFWELQVTLSRVATREFETFENTSETKVRNYLILQ